MGGLVSILIPAYNCDKWLAESIKSALNQTWHKKEIIIVDDGSTDNTLKLARTFVSKSLKVITQENRGASAARNVALNFAQGDLIQWLDADDILAYDKIEQQLKQYDINRDSLILLSSSWCKFLVSYKRGKFYPSCLWQDLDPLDWLIMKMEEDAMMCIESWLVSRRLTEMAGPWNENLFRDNDGEYFSRVIKNSEQIKFVASAKCYCRTGNWGSISSETKLSDIKLESLLRSIGLNINLLRKLEDSERVRSACLLYLQRMLGYFYPEHHAIVSELNKFAEDLGGNLVTPEVGNKYVLLKKVFGWKVAKKAQYFMPNIKKVILKSWEKYIYW